MRPDYNRAARYAYLSLQSLHIENFPVDPLMILSYCKNTVVRTYEDVAPFFGMSDPEEFKYCVMENKDAMTARCERNGTVTYELIYDSRGNPFRRRFTLAHELGHIVLRHTLEAQHEEKEADYFAAQLLAPHPVFDLIKRHGMNASDPEFIAETFKLSKAASEIAVRPPLHQPDRELYQSIRKQFEPYFELQALFL